MLSGIPAMKYIVRILRYIPEPPEWYGCLLYTSRVVVPCLSAQYLSIAILGFFALLYGFLQFRFQDSSPQIVTVLIHVPVSYTHLDVYKRQTVNSSP